MRLNTARSIVVLLGWLMCTQLFAKDEVVYFHNDILGSATIAYSEAGDICWRQDYSPYGHQLSDEDLVPLPGCGLLGRERGFTGHTQDLSGLVYMEQRYYDPQLLRFVSRDPIDVNPEDERTFNRYHYAANNPYRYVDPHGEAIFLFPLAPIAAAIAKELASEGVSLGVSVLTNGTINNAGDFLSTRKAAANIARKVASKGNYSRPSGFRKGIRDKAWDNAKEKSTGQVRDSATGRFMSKNKPWDMGHKPGHEFRKHQKSAQQRGISRKKFLDEHNDSNNYRPELPSSNRSHRGEDKTDNYFGL